MTSVLYESQNQLRREQDDQRLMPSQATVLRMPSCAMPAPPTFQTSTDKVFSAVPNGSDPIMASGLTASFSRPVSPTSSDGELTKTETNAVLATPADAPVSQMTRKEAVLAPLITPASQQVTITSVPVSAPAPATLQPAPAPTTWQPAAPPASLQPAAQVQSQGTITAAPTLIPSTPVLLQSSFPSLQSISLSTAPVPTPILPYGATTFTVTASAPAPPVFSSPAGSTHETSVLVKAGQISSPGTNPLESGSPPPQQQDQQQPQQQQQQQQSGNGGNSNSNSLRLNKFVRRLHDMLQSEKDSGIVEWRRGLLILHSTDTFGKKILPRYFNTRNFKTFRRQLNYYGFVHVRSFSATGSTTTALWVNQDLAKRGCENISSVLMLKRVEPCEAAKTAEGRRVRKEEAVCAVEDIGISTRSLQFEHIRSLTLQRSHDDDPSTTTIDSTTSSEAFASTVANAPTANAPLTKITPGPTVAPTMPSTAPPPPSQHGLATSQTANFLPLVVHCHHAPQPAVVTPPSDQGGESSDDASSATSQVASDAPQPMEVSYTVSAPEFLSSSLSPVLEAAALVGQTTTTLQSNEECSSRRLEVMEQAPAVPSEEVLSGSPSSTDDAANLLLMLSRSKTCSLSTTNAVEGAAMTEPAAVQG